MTKEVKTAAIKALTECGCSGFTKEDITALEAFSDARIEALTATASARRASDAKLAELKTAAECKTCKGEGKAFGKECPDCKGTGELKAAELVASLKAAQAAQIPAEELTELRTLAADKKAADVASKAALVGQLKTAQTAFTETELNEKSITELTKLALLAKVEVRDFSGKGVPVPRNAAAQDFTPPNAYDAGIKALQAVN